MRRGLALSPFGCAQGKLRRMGGYLWSLAYRQVDFLPSFLSEVWYRVLSKGFGLCNEAFTFQLTAYLRACEGRR